MSNAIEETAVMMYNPRAVLAGMALGAGLPTDTPRLPRDVSMEYEELKAALKDPRLVYINMMRGVVATPTIEMFIHMYGDKIPEVDAANLEIIKLRDKVKELEDELKLYTD